MGWSIDQRVKEHVFANKLGRTKSWALAEPAVKTKHHICIVEVKLFAKISHFINASLGKPLELRDLLITSVGKMT